MTKNKALHVKIIFKTYLKIGLKHFMFLNTLLFYKSKFISNQINIIHNI